MALLPRTGLRDNRPLVIAHRGASFRTPENTCLAVTTAIELGADMVEVDVQLTGDGHAVVFHDWNLARVGRSTSYSPRQLRSLGVSDLRLKEVKRLDVGSWMDVRFADLRIPTLPELLAAIRRRIAVNLELKIPALGTEHTRAALIDRVGEAVALHGDPDATLVSSFDLRVLELARTVCPTWRLGLLPQAEGMAETLHRAVRLQAFSLHLPCDKARATLVRSLRERDVQVLAYTANRPSTLNRLIETGVGGIFTNIPDRLVSLLHEQATLQTTVRHP